MPSNQSGAQVGEKNWKGPPSGAVLCPASYTSANGLGVKRWGWDRPQCLRSTRTIHMLPFALGVWVPEDMFHLAPESQQLGVP